MPNPSDRFCIYCQIDFETYKELVDHIKKIHRHTYAYNYYVKGQE